jgi:hypothetical protein
MFILLFFLVFAESYPIGPINCDKSDEAFLRCFTQLFDQNHDGRVTFTELGTVFRYHIKYNANMTPEIMMQADLNHDGVLDMQDWNNPARTFYKEDMHKIGACVVCRRNGVNMDLAVKKK